MSAVSVVIPARNAARFIGEALDSVLVQGLTDVEVVVVDDGSIDDTPEVVRSFGEGVRLIHGSGKGSAHARNLGVASSGGELLAFLDADDTWCREKLRLQLDLLARCPDLAMVFSDMQNFDESGDQPGTYFSQRGFDGRCTASSILLYDMVSTPTVVLRRHAFEDAGGFDESLPIGQDTDLWLRIAAQGRFGVIPQPLVRRRLHGGNVTRDRLLLARSVVRVWGRHLDRCCAAEPERERALRRDFRGKRWHFHYLDGCEHRKRGERREALGSLARAILLYPLRPGPWLVAAASLVLRTPRERA